MEDIKTYSIAVLVAVVAFLGWQIYLNHIKIEKLAEKKENNTSVVTAC